MYERIGTVDEDTASRLSAALTRFVQIGGNPGQEANYQTTSKLPLEILSPLPLDIDFVQSIAVRIKPGGVLHEHTHDKINDQGKIRYHIVLETNDDCECWNGGVAYKLEKYGIYSMQPYLPHKSFNRGDTDRTHLILVTNGEYRDS